MQSPASEKKSINSCFRPDECTSQIGQCLTLRYDGINLKGNKKWLFACLNGAAYSVEEDSLLDDDHVNKLN